MQATLLLDVASSEWGLSVTEEEVEVHEVGSDRSQRQKSSPNKADGARPKEEEDGEEEARAEVIPQRDPVTAGPLVYAHPWRGRPGGDGGVVTHVGGRNVHALFLPSHTRDRRIVCVEQIKAQALRPNIGAERGACLQHAPFHTMKAAGAAAASVRQLGVLAWPYCPFPITSPYPSPTRATNGGRTASPRTAAAPAGCSPGG